MLDMAAPPAFVDPLALASPTSPTPGGRSASRRVPVALDEVVLVRLVTVPAIFDGRTLLSALAAQTKRRASAPTCLLGIPRGSTAG
jgi:hypothetical protein